MALRRQTQHDTRRMREALRDAVRQRALTYAQIEQELGVHRGDLKRLLAGRIDLPVAHVFRLLRILGMEPWKFFLWLLVTEEGGGGRNPTPTPPALPSP